MKIIASAIIAGSAALAVACSGSNGNENRTAADRTGTARARATLTGCLKGGDEPGSYVLQMASAADVATPGTASSTPSSAGDTTSERMFRVVAEKADDLAEHVNQRVAVNGYVESGTTATATGTGGMRSNTTSSGYGAPNMQASPETIGHGSSSQTGGAGAVGTSGGSGTGSGQPYDRTDTRGAGSPSGGGIRYSNTGIGMQTLRAESIRKVADSCVEGPPAGANSSGR